MKSDDDVLTELLFPRPINVETRIKCVDSSHHVDCTCRVLCFLVFVSDPPGTVLFSVPFVCLSLPLD